MQIANLHEKCVFAGTMLLDVVVKVGSKYFLKKCLL